MSAWLGNVVSMLDPGIIVIGGGVMNGTMGQALFTRLREQVPRRTVNPYAGGLQIMPALFGPESGVLGAGIVAANAF